MQKHLFAAPNASIGGTHAEAEEDVDAEDEDARADEDDGGDDDDEGGADYAEDSDDIDDWED
jgi:hypothetical protein